MGSTTKYKYFLLAFLLCTKLLQAQVINNQLSPFNGVPTIGCRKDFFNSDNCLRMTSGTEAPPISPREKNFAPFRAHVYAPQTGIRLGFYGFINYPGFSLGVERPYKYTRLYKLKPGKKKVVYKERYLNYTFAMYHRSTYHTNYMLQAEWLIRRQSSRHFYYESSFGLGLSRTFVDGAAYTVSDNGEVEKTPLSGNWYGLASLGISLGYNTNVKDPKNYAVYLKHQWLLFFPYNGIVSPRPVIELCFRYNLGGFWEASPVYKQKEKQSRKYKETKE